MKLYSSIPLNPDDHVYFHIAVKPITGLLNEAGFDSETYYFSQRIVAKAYVSKNSEYTVVSQPSFRMRLYQHVKQLLHEHPYQGLLLALSFADRTGLTDDQWHQLKASGLAHLVAISGLHIGIAYAFGFYLGSGISRIHPLLLWFPVVLGSGCAGFYAWLAGFSLPTQRALCMVLIHVFLRVAHIRVETSWRFLITLACLLTINPFSGVSASFWLSFSAVFFVLYFMRLANDEPSGLWHWLRHHMRLMVCMLSPSSYLLGGISVVSPLYNLVFIPWFSILVIPVLFLALLLSAIDYPNAVFVWAFIRYLLMPLIWSIRLAEDMWWSTSESMTNVLLFLTLLMVLKPVLSARSLYFYCLMAIGYLIESQHVTGWRVDVLDVGHGLAILIEKNHHHVLYDTGKQWRGGSIAQSVIDPVLHLRGAGQLDGLVLSHMDNDHAGGRVWIAKHWHPLWMRASQSLNGYLSCVRGEQWSWQGLQFAVLWPPQRVKRAKNTHSCVVKISDPRSGYSLLLTGDMTLSNEWSVLQGNQSVDSDVLIVPHHGSRTSSSKKFIEQVHPQLAIASVAKNNRWHLPNQTIVQRYHSLGIQWLDTGDSGQISIIFHDKGQPIQIRKQRLNAFSAWYRQMLRKRVE